MSDSISQQVLLVGWGASDSSQTGDICNEWQWQGATGAAQGAGRGVKSSCEQVCALRSANLGQVEGSWQEL